jgi:ABC-type phosphate transport system substrate-binding protein
MHDFLQVPSVRSQVERVTYFRAIVPKIAETRGAIGYCRLRDVEGQQEQTAKVLKIKKTPESPGILPSRSSIADESYPIRRPFALCFDGNSGNAIKKFVDFIVSRGWGGSDRN